MNKILILVIVSALFIGITPTNRTLCNVDEDNCMCNPDELVCKANGVSCPPPSRPSPCGPNAECKLLDDVGTCACLTDSYHSPPFCRKSVCQSNKDCADNLTCISTECTDPCTELCGLNAECYVIKNVPICKCLANYFGDPFVECKEGIRSE